MPDTQQWQPRYVLYCRDIGKSPGWEAREGVAMQGFVCWSHARWREFFAAKGIKPDPRTGEPSRFDYDHDAFAVWFNEVLDARTLKAA